ncbi:helix-turn-helix domain-containing protein [Caulobacter sp. SLTY]|uniref:Crp/Fnr family transcriptional regulator n=1 Tax=Caulobacter sp. SLTY TaxID=2683262 RepID=UPI0014128C28|nr:Crp/Fnr family transcriptional regulator [Caulobacter sp. SLTY]NBB14272.1 helix-turn-helix domain-containing protein [Caulobacter sp. SLTY]
MDPAAPLIRRLEARDDLSPAEREVLSGIVDRIETYAPGQIVVPEGKPLTESQLLVSGLCARSKAMADGRRQITSLHIDGDFVDLHGFLLKRLEHDVVAISAIRMAMVPHGRLKAITEQMPHLTRMLWLSTLMDAAIHREWIVSAGRRSASEQVSHLLCELFVRYQVVGGASGDRLALPLTQEQLADACGLTPVHVNRVIGQLRAEGLIDWRRGEVVFSDFEGLARKAQFDPAYLILNHEPR